MTDNAYAKSALAQVAMEFVPQLIRQTLLEDSDFRDEYGLTTDGLLSFGDADVSVQQSDFFDAVRHVLSDFSENEVTDKKGQRWKLRNIGGVGELPCLSLSCSTNPLPTYLIALSPDRDTRLRSFDEDITVFNLPRDATNYWHNILSRRALRDEEVEDFRNHFRDTPVAIAQAIRTDILRGESTVSSLVPSSRRYFERLVGVYDGSATIRDYASGTGKELIHQLVSWRSYDGILTSLYLSSHEALTDEFNVDKMSSDELVRAYGFLEKYGDRISQLGAIEVGLRVLSSRPEIEESLKHIIEQIRDDDVNGKMSGFKLLSTLFCLVDGELSRIRLFAEEPPFYRRLAALSHASLIHREVAGLPIDVDRFVEWAQKNRGGIQYLQSLVDMRSEPHWDGRLAVESQVKANFVGRIVCSARKQQENLSVSPIYNLVFGGQEGSLQSLGDIHSQSLPGPLEGTDGMQRKLPLDGANTIEEQLNSERVGPSSFVTLVNCAHIYRIGTQHADSAAKALDRAGYRLQDIENRSQFVNISNGLATVAAVTRSQTLASKLRILVHGIRHDNEYALTVSEIVTICLVAAACHQDVRSWTGYVGDWLTELAFSDLDEEEGEELHSILNFLFHAVPDLWVTCGTADAALEAFNAR